MRYRGVEIQNEILKIVFIEGKHTETGAGKSKKLAKRQAANKMIKKLRELPMENEDAFQNIDDDELAQGLSQRYSQVKEANMKVLNANHSQQVSRFHKNLKLSQVISENSFLFIK